jgi:hypothetical protein
MLTFFFDLADDEMIDDKNGVSLPSEKEARRYAVTFTRELIAIHGNFSESRGMHGRCKSATASLIAS